MWLIEGGKGSGRKENSVMSRRTETKLKEGCTDIVRRYLPLGWKIETWKQVTGRSQRICRGKGRDLQDRCADPFSQIGIRSSAET